MLMELIKSSGVAVITERVLLLASYGGLASNRGTR
jgi:hypothetical protein